LNERDPTLVQPSDGAEATFNTLQPALQQALAMPAGA